MVLLWYFFFFPQPVRLIKPLSRFHQQVRDDFIIQVKRVQPKQGPADHCLLSITAGFGETGSYFTAKSDLVFSLMISSRSA